MSGKNEIEIGNIYCIGQTRTVEFQARVCRNRGFRVTMHKGQQRSEF
ncbi:hypothetical protein Pla52n_53890 [Stieleria varia]|uniref:Uncharacterized protein n=1 Tax=Stieleria varia TaxID=2528005 RepID=A0A5C6A5I8_9BACT|nr:hypothetical protein Pla52n_53890 [Stieleria varia]